VSVPVHWYVAVSVILFLMGLVTILARRNLIYVLMGVEMILNSANINFVAFARYGGTPDGVVTGTTFGIFIIVIKAVFFVLYLLGSRFAWRVGFGLSAVITALALLLIYRGAKAGELDCSLRHFLELIVAVPLALYQWRIRERYFRYIQNRRANLSVY